MESETACELTARTHVKSISAFKDFVMQRQRERPLAGSGHYVTLSRRKP